MDRFCPECKKKKVYTFTELDSSLADSFCIDVSKDEYVFNADVFIESFCPIIDNDEIYEFKELETSFCYCGVDEVTLEEEKCYTIKTSSKDYISYLYELSNKKDHLKYPCDISKELEPQYLEFIYNDYYIEE